VNCRRVPNGGHPHEANLAGPAQGLERRQNPVEHLVGPGLAAGARRADGVVELKEIDAVAPEPPETRLERVRHGLLRIGEALLTQADLGRHEAAGLQ
jgi:hypothetical protein